MNNDLNDIARALVFAKPDAIELDDGAFVAQVVLDISLANAKQCIALLEYLTGHIDENHKLFISPVADVNQRPVPYPTQAQAMNAATQRAQGIQREFMYGVYASTGLALDISSAQTLYFKKKV